MKQNSTPEFDLYNCNEYIARGDIWKGSNYLTNLSDKKCKEELEKNYSSTCIEKGIKERKKKSRLIYHKIVWYVATKTKRTSEFYDGFFTLELSTNSKVKRKYYTTFKGVIGCIERENQSIKSFVVGYGYSERGEPLKKRGGSNE